MPSFVRVDLRLDRWFTHPLVPWLPPGEIQADALLDLKVKDNGLSVFELPVGVDIERVVVAVIAKRQNPTATDVGYSIFEGADALRFGIRFERRLGQTPDAAVNDLHYDLEHLTVRQLLGFATVIARGRRDSVLPKRIGEVIQAGVGAGWLDTSVMNKAFLVKRPP